MATIENRSRYIVTVRNRDDLTKTFAYTRIAELREYIAGIKDKGLKPQLTRTNDTYAVRVRENGHKNQCLYASSETEAVNIKRKLELERRTGLIVDYTIGRSVTFADLLKRYLREIAPRHKGFETEGYIINAMLADAGLQRLDLAEVYAAHKNPNPQLKGKVFKRLAGKTVRKPAPATRFICKPFADVVPEDFNDYIDDRCQSVEAATVDREIDLFSATCRLAIDTWRIPVAKNPMDGVQRPKYFNERDRRLRGDEESRLLTAAFNEDAQRSIEAKLEELIAIDRAESEAASTVYRRKQLIKAARNTHLTEAEATYVHEPTLETFVQFQLMSAARRSETLDLAWSDIDFNSQTAFIKESKNGRPRKLPLRSDLIALLRRLPRKDAKVFPISIDALRKAWTRICNEAGLVSEDELHIHDLRHEAISRVADAGAKLPGGISLVDLQAFSGHRDTRMLLRYTHLCMPSLAKRLDMAFSAEEPSNIHRGRRRLNRAGPLSMSDLTAAEWPTPFVGTTRLTATTLESGVVTAEGLTPTTGNVLPFRRPERG